MSNAEEYLKNYELDGFRGKSETTKKTYLGVVSKFNSWLEGTGTDIGDFTFVELQQYMDHLKANDAKASTINKNFNAIKHYCRFIGKTEVYEYVNVMKQSKAIQAPKALPRNERNAMLREANRKSARDYAIICMLLYTGVRVEECSNLQIKHLFDIGEKSGYVRVISKGNKERVVPLNATLRQALTIYFKERGIDFYDKSMMEKHKQEPVFLSTHNKNVSVRRIQQLVSETGNTHPHTLRHTFATVLLREKGYDIVTVAQLMGHGSLSMTQRYTAATKEDMLNMVENFDA